MEIKKDWLYNYKLSTFGMIALGFVLGIIFSIATLFGNRDSILFMQSMYRTFHSTSMIFVTLYFVYCFQGIAPQYGNNKLYLNTTNLPFSRKQLFFKGLKPLLIVFPIYILFGVFINTFLIQEASPSFTLSIYEGYSFNMLFIYNLALIMWSFIYMFIMALQMISAIILSLSKNIRWYIMAPCMILFNGILIGLLIVGNVIFKFNLDSSFISNYELSIIFSWLNGNTLIFFIPSLILFLFAWRNIEKIHR